MEGGRITKRNMGSVDRLSRAFLVAPVSIVLGVAVFGIDTRGGLSTHGHVRFGGPPRAVTHD